MTDLHTCLIPAAGVGIRARPYTKALPKAMLKVNGKPILQHTIENLRDQLDVTTCVVIIGYCGDVIQNHFGDGKTLGVNIRYVVNEQVEKGLAWSIFLGRKLVEDTFLVLLGDEIYNNSNHGDLNNQSMDGALATCGLIATNDEDLIRQNYTLQCSGNRITRLFEKPDRIDEKIMGTGTFVLSSDIFPLIRRFYKTAKEHGEVYVDFISMLDGLCRQGHLIKGFFLEGEYVNINDISALHKANDLFKDEL